jgi:hypothetical protein
MKNVLVRRSVSTGKARILLNLSSLEFSNYPEISGNCAKQNQREGSSSSPETPMWEVTIYQCWMDNQSETPAPCCCGLPVRGKHALALVDSAQRTVDSMTFEVRGNLSIL